MKLLKSKHLIYSLAFILIFVSLFSLTGCKEEQPVEEPKTPAEMNYDEFVAFILPAYICEDFGTVYENSCVNYNYLFDDRLTNSGEDKKEYFKQLSYQYGYTIEDYVGQMKAEFTETDQMLKTRFGDDYAATYTITKDTVFSIEDTQKVGTLIVVTFEAKGYSFSRYFDPSKLTGAHEITFDYKIKGSKGEATGEDTILLLKYNDRWTFGEVDI